MEETLVKVSELRKKGVWHFLPYSQPANFNSHLARLRLKPEVDPEYLVSYLNSDLGQSLIRSFTTGSVRPVITLAALLSVPVIVPPLAEQRRIALKARSLAQEATQLRENARERQEEARHLFSDLLEGGIE